MDYLRIIGIYDPKLIQVLKAEGLKAFSFDCRPMNQNFTQAHLISEMVNENLNEFDLVTLVFNNDKDFVIKNTLENLCRDTDLELNKNIELEFTQSNTLEYYNQFDSYFGVHYSEQIRLNSLIACENCKRIVFNQSYLESLHAENAFFPFFTEVFKQISLLRKSKLKIELKIDWKNEILTSIIDFFPIDGVVIEVNQQVELEYRNLNINLIQEHLTHKMMYLQK